MRTVPAHYSVGAVQENSVYLFAQTYFADVLIVFFFDFQNLSQLSYLLLKPTYFLLHLYLLSRGDLLVTGQVVLVADNLEGLV